MVAMLGLVLCVYTYGMECMGSVREPHSKLRDNLYV